MRSARIFFGVCIALLIAVGTVAAAPAEHATTQSSNAIRMAPFEAVAGCFPEAEAVAWVTPTRSGVDRLIVQARGLPPHTTFTLFLTETPDLPFGAAQYLASFTTNRAGWGWSSVYTEVDDAFSSTLVNEERVRAELDHIVIWFADSAADDGCLGAGAGPVTPFDDDGEAGIGMLQSVVTENNPLAR